MTIKLITYSRAFYPYVWQYKTTVTIEVFLVLRGDKLLKRSFAETCAYANEGTSYGEIDAFAAGLSWIIQNVPDVDKERLEVVFCGAARTKVKKDIENGALFNNYKLESILAMICKFGGVIYSSQGKIITEDDNDIFNLYDFANKVFELHYGRDIGFMHTIYEEVGENKKMMIVGEPEMWLKYGSPTEGWS
jgi:hypothetical protein